MIRSSLALVPPEAVTMFPIAFPPVPPIDSDPSTAGETAKLPITTQLLLAPESTSACVPSKVFLIPVATESPAFSPKAEFEFPETHTNNEPCPTAVLL